MNIEDLIVAARRKLLADSRFSSLIGTDVGRDGIGGAYRDAWVFRSVDDNYTSERDVEGSGTSAVVISSDLNWTSPTRDKTLRFPQLRFDIWADCTRSATDDSLPIAKDARYRADRVATVIREIFHDAGNRVHLWPNNVYVVSSVLWNDLNVGDVDTRPNIVHGDLSFAIITY